MKTIKLLIITLSIIITSCTSDDDFYTDHIDTTVIIPYEVIYDSQDNIVKLNGNWVQSIDLDTWEPANDTLGVRHDWNNRTLYIKSINYQIENVELQDLGHYVTISNNVASIYIPTMHEHMQHTDWFRFNIDLKAY